MKFDKSKHRITITLKSGIRDIRGENLELKVDNLLGYKTGRISTAKSYAIDYDLSEKELQFFADEGVSDKVINNIAIGYDWKPEGMLSYIAVSKKPGVTDDEGMSAQKTLFDMISQKGEVNRLHIFTSEVYFLEMPLSQEALSFIAQLLGNKMIHNFTFGNLQNGIEIFIPEVHITSDEKIELIDLPSDEEQLLKISDERLLSLNLDEMKAIRNYFLKSETQVKRKNEGAPQLPTDCELEIIGQTWSEHCKHKEFNAVINYKRTDKGITKRIDSLFNTYIKASTEKVSESLESNGNNWLVKVFSDNAGAVKLDEKNLFIWKVETHNSPSAIDPYGGAITGILGNNRDPMATGIGGAKLLFNTNVLCFGNPEFNGKLLKGQLHPRVIMEGVVKGIEDGGNKSGIPTVNGAVIFDDRYSGKPLVYCGTGGILPITLNGRNSWEKIIENGDLIVMAGGRVGKDGIHGATFSSLELDENSPQSAVQIGSPITQKILSDFLEVAARNGLIRCSTDCGAGGLSSSIGELAEITNGAVVNLEKVPLKYSGLKPWEIFLSESQERMVLAVDPEKLKDLHELSILMETEISVIGKFNSDSFLRIKYDGKLAAFLEIDFLHHGVPKKYLEAEWENPKGRNSVLPKIDNHNEILIRLLSSLNICSREAIIRRYDHEVKGKTIIKPLMGKFRKSPQDAAIVRTNFETFEGVAVSNGIVPKLVDQDPYNSSAAAFDEAVRSIIAVGGKLPGFDGSEEIFWSVNDNFCVPDSVYHPTNNPDGRKKLGQLIEMCEALYDMAVYFNIPMTSGKDSMKNDFKAEGVKISVPPTLLYSMASKINDVRETVTAEFKNPGDLIYIIGETYDELGCSELFKLLGIDGGDIPIVRKEDAKRRYTNMMKSNSLNLIKSCHDLSDGGLAIGIAESLFGNMLGAEITLDNISDDIPFLYSESQSRFIVSIKKENKESFEQIFLNDATYIGFVKADPELRIMKREKEIVKLKTEKLVSAWSGGLSL